MGSEMCIRDSASPGPTVIQVDGPRSVITSLGQHAPADSAFWEHAVTKQMGVIGNDFRGVEEIGSASFERASNWAVVPNFFNFWTRRSNRTTTGRWCTSSGRWPGPWIT